MINSFTRPSTRRPTVIQFKCMHCEAVLRFSGTSTGGSMVCPHCAGEVRIPLAGSKQRRGSNRRMSSPMPIHVAGDDVDEPEEATIINRSQGGLCLSLSQAVDVGTRLQVRAPVPVDVIPWIPVEVKYCRPFGNRWKVGCEYVEEPPEDVLLMFG